MAQRLARRALRWHATVISGIVATLTWRVVPSQIWCRSQARRWGTAARDWSGDQSLHWHVRRGDVSIHGAS
jgi:hypothetical protein